MRLLAHIALAMTTTNDTTEHMFSPSEIMINEAIERIARFLDKYVISPLLGTGQEAID